MDSLSLLPYGRKGYPSYQYPSSNQIHHQYYPNRYVNSGGYYPPYYPIHSSHQSYFSMANIENMLNNWVPYNWNIVASEIESFLAELDHDYQSWLYERNNRKLQRLHERLYGPYYSWPNYPTKAYFPTDAPYGYENETRFLSMPTYGDAPNTPFCSSETEYYGSGIDPYCETVGGMNLMPKVRVIFVPENQSLVQQPYIGPLSMPNFLYNRMEQPLNAFPLPPPLPEFGSLSLTPAVQQMVVQRYSNPVAMLPNTLNWQTPQLMMSNYLQYSSYQPQRALPVSAFEPYPIASQVCNTYMTPNLPSFQLASPLSIVPTTVPSYPLANTSRLSSISSMAQPYTSAMVPSGGYMLQPSQPSLQQTYLNSNIPNLSLPQYYSNDYPSVCRACPPAPPPLSISVMGHCWVQHCAACHHVPTSVSNPNVRPANGRCTPLLRHPTVQQYSLDMTAQQQQQQQQQRQYLDTQHSVLLRPWLRKTPPLPPGAVVISDCYVQTRDSSLSGQNRSRKHKRDRHNSYWQPRSSTTIVSKTVTKQNQSTRFSRSESPSKKNNGYRRKSHSKELKNLNIERSKTISSTSSSGLAMEYHKTTLHPFNNQIKAIPSKLVDQARRINLHYEYQPQDIPLVYNTNRYLTSDSETSILNPVLQTTVNAFPLLENDVTATNASSIDFISTKEQSDKEKENEHTRNFHFQMRRPRESSLVVRQYMARPSSTTSSTFSSDSPFSIVDKDIDENFKSHS